MYDLRHVKCVFLPARRARPREGPYRLLYGVFRQSPPSVGSIPECPTAGSGPTKGRFHRRSPGRDSDQQRIVLSALENDRDHRHKALDDDHVRVDPAHGSPSPIIGLIGLSSIAATRKKRKKRKKPPP
jgi:hypothetical protein